jgi:hypothetical protein
MNKERLLKLADFLDELDDSKFNFSHVIEKYDTENNCGTVCCAMGWVPVVFPDIVKWCGGDDVYNPNNVELINVSGFSNYVDVAKLLFDIPREDASSLFTPKLQDKIIGKYECDLPIVDHDATPDEVANLIRKYVDLITNLD